MRRLGFLLFFAALVTLAGCSKVNSPRTVVVDIHHSRFTPKSLSFVRGDEVRFVIRNTDPIDHEFILGDDEVQTRHENGTETQHGTVPGEVSIAAGTEASTTYRFERSGSLIFGCHLPGHYQYGMKGTVVVT
jgi:uncharacterized cupredoxin-like copper-binding protein